MTTPTPEPYPGSNPAFGTNADANAAGAAYPTGGYPGTGSYGAQPFGEPERNKLAPWGLALGIASIILSWTAAGGIILGIVGLILSIVALRKTKVIMGPFQRKGMSIGGLILSIIGLISGIIATVFFVFAVQLFGDVAESCSMYVANSPEFADCVNAQLNIDTAQNS